MKYRKVISFKLKNLLPMAMIAGSTIFFGACHKKPVPEPPHHNTTYVWGEDDWSQIWPADKVAASADSTLVDYVILYNNGVSFNAKSTTLLLRQLNMIIEEVKPENRHKIRGAGTLNEVNAGTEQDYQDSIKLANLGFKFGRVYHIK
ncbi:MAG: hypothetical protein J6W40_05550 [Alphaproteobacteria bacterium]|nr:hypothetical protein [Alphaproteobacteria bacterium]